MIYRHEQQEYKDAIELANETLVPTDNDSVYIETLRRSYHWAQGSNFPADGLLIIEQLSQSTTGRWVSEISSAAIIPRPIISLVAKGGEPTTTFNGGVPFGSPNKVFIAARYPSGYDEFETLVATGRVRLQLMHFDGRATIRHTDKGKKTIFKQKQRIAARYVRHNNGAQDAGDYLLGGACLDNGGSKYPDRNGMVYLDPAQRAGMVTDFEIDASLYYGRGGAALCGQIANLFPIELSTARKMKEFSLCGEGSKENFNQRGSDISFIDRKYFQFVFMFKKPNGKWIVGEPSEKFYIDLKIGNQDDGNGGKIPYFVGFRSRFT